MNDGFKISIITVVYNGVEFLEETIKSVISQTYKNTEYIIIDGGSTDGTVDIIKKYEDKITYWISEPDKGIYDAMNKGIKRATGDIVGILNSDDFYASNDVLKTIAGEFTNKEIDCLYGDLDFVEQSDASKVTKCVKSKPYKGGIFTKNWSLSDSIFYAPPHPTFFVKRVMYKKYGLFNINLSIAADYELMLRFLEKHKLKSSYVNKVLVKMRQGGISDQNIIQAKIQSYKSLRMNGLSAPLFFVLWPLSKIVRFLKK